MLWNPILKNSLPSRAGPCHSKGQQCPCVKCDFFISFGVGSFCACAKLILLTLSENRKSLMVAHVNWHQIVSIDLTGHGNSFQFPTTLSKHAPIIISLLARMLTEHITTCQPVLPVGARVAMRVDDCVSRSSPGSQSMYFPAESCWESERHVPGLFNFLIQERCSVKCFSLKTIPPTCFYTGTPKLCIMFPLSDAISQWMKTALDSGYITDASTECSVHSPEFLTSTWWSQSVMFFF